MWIVKLAIHRPYTIVVMAILMTIFGLFSAARMPTDIFPAINIPVVAAVWTYNGMPSWDMEARIVKVHELSIPSVVNNVERIESNSYASFGIIKVFLYPGSDPGMAVAQMVSCAQNVLKQMPAGTVLPNILQYSATDVPVIQVVMSSQEVTDDVLNDLMLTYVRPRLSTVHGAQLPYPFGGRQKQMMVDLDPKAMRAKGVSPDEVVAAIQRQNVIIPSGTIKIGKTEYTVQLNNVPTDINEVNDYPVKAIGNAVIYIRDIGHAHAGSAVQTNAVNQNGHDATLLQVRRTEGANTLAVVQGVKQAMPYLQAVLPKNVELRQLFDQSFFVKSALYGVATEGAVAAGLTGLMILLFLGNWRSTVIIMATIPLAVLCGMIGLYVFGNTLNNMTLGGLALSLGILVDNATVTVENIERQFSSGTRSLEKAILDGAEEIGLPTLVATFAICIVFVPIFLLEGVAKYLFSPLSLAVIIALLASFLLSRTLVPTLFVFLMGRATGQESMELKPQGRHWEFFWRLHLLFANGFERMRNRYRASLGWMLRHRLATIAFFLAFLGASLPLFRSVGQDFFPTVDAGQIRLSVRCPPGTRLELTQELFGKVEREIGRIIPPEEIDVLLDNIGMPVSGISKALSDSATCGAMDGEIQISLAKHHRPSAEYLAAMREILPAKFPELQFFFQPADVVNQVLNFGLQAPIDIRIGGPDPADNYRVAQKILRGLRGIEGLVDTRIFQVVDSPQLYVRINREKAQEMQLSQLGIAAGMLVSLSSSGVYSPAYWVNPQTMLNYLFAAQTPQYWMDSMNELWTTPLSNPGGTHQLLLNLGDTRRGRTQMIASHADIMPVIDIHANVQGRDLSAVARDLDRSLAATKAEQPGHEWPRGVRVYVAGQVESMRTSFQGLAGGLIFSVVLVYLLLVVNYHSWIDPLIILMAVPVSLGGVGWMLFTTQTHVSVPALMGMIMGIGLVTANSILVVSFCNQQRELGKDALTAALVAGHTRIRPVIMTATAMILGMLPMSLGLGEGGEQNAPLGRAVIGGLLVAPYAVLFFVPVVYSLLRRKAPKHRKAWR